MTAMAIVFVRGLGAFLAITFLSSFALILGSQLLIRGWDRVEVQGLVGPAAMIIVGILVMAWSKNLARLLLAGVKDATPSTLQTSQLLQLGTALLGLFFAAAAVPSIGSAAGYYLAAAQGSEDVPGARADQIRSMSSALSGVGSAIVGAVLIWMARGVFSRERTVTPI